MNRYNILIVGVGGQGVLLASELLSGAALEAGYDVKKSEVHGMAQRGGSVSSHVRLGERIRSPLIPEGLADALLAFEQAEALRWIHFVKPEGVAVVNEKRLVPPIALLKGKGPGYPADPMEALRGRVRTVVSVPAERIAVALGNPKTENTVLLGALSRVLDIPETIWTEVIRTQVPKGTDIVNLEAFRKGAEWSD
jgi:indolepyruvate ferredoxin oxidoreductase, beta subunit